MSTILYYVLTLTFAVTGLESANLRFYHGSLLNYTETPVEEPLQLLPFFNKTRVSMFYIFGFNETADSEDARIMVSAYLDTGYTNVVLLDWSNEARALWDNAPLSYVFLAVPNSKTVGRAFGKALVTYINNGISADIIHVVGHSLGAHVAGYAGEFVKDCNLELSRVTGLDPAGPLFDGTSDLGGLTPSVAKFVDVLHTNPGQYGISKSIGSVDFWANCGYPIQPGCPNDTEKTDVLDSLCSHWRSFEIFSEAIMSPTSIIAVKADNCTSWLSRSISSEDILYLGDLIDTRARGNHYFSTSNKAPLSKERAGLTPN